MTTEVVTAVPSTPFKEIAARLAQHRISALPVVDPDRRVLGIVTEADLLLKQEHPTPGDRPPSSGPGAVARNGPKPPPRRPGACTPPGVKRLPVVDERGQLPGIVSRADLLKVFTPTRRGHPPSSTWS